jgi:hypothetical protein
MSIVFGLCCYTSDTGQAEVAIWNMVRGLSPNHKNAKGIERELFAYAARSLAQVTQQKW